MATPDKYGVPQLSGVKNYLYWSVKAMAFLIKEGVTGNNLDFQGLSAVNNRKATAYIQLMCEEGPLMHIKDKNTALETWETLKELYKPSGFTTEYLILKDFFNTTLEEYDTMEEYLNKVKQLTEDLKTNNINLPKQVIIAWVLNSLDENYEGFIQNITQSLRKDPNSYSVDTLFANLLDESRGKEKNTTKALILRGKNQKKQYSSEYKQCNNCNLKGHTRENCYFLHPNKAPRSWKVEKKKKENSRIYKPNISRLKREKLQEKLLAALANSGSEEEEEEEEEEKFEENSEKITTTLNPKETSSMDLEMLENTDLIDLQETI